MDSTSIQSRQCTDWETTLLTCILSIPPPNISLRTQSSKNWNVTIHDFMYGNFKAPLGEFPATGQPSRNLFSPESGTEVGCQQLFTKFTITQPMVPSLATASCPSSSPASLLPSLLFFQPQTSNPLSLNLTDDIWIVFLFPCSQSPINPLS